MRILRKSVTVGLCVCAVGLLAASGSSSSSSGSGGGSSGSGPVTIGTSLSLSGDFAADGQAFQKGYQLWVHDQNAKGGLLVFDMIELMNRQGKTILLGEQNARAGLKLSAHGIVLEHGMVRLAGSGREVLGHPEIGALYLGGAVAGGAR